MFDNLLPPLNDHNLPYPDTIHPIVVHFVIAMVLFAFFCDIVGYFTRNYKLYEVSWWNMFVATISIFIAIIFGQIEAGLAIAYDAVEPILNLHTLIGWSLSGIIAAITGWRYVIRSKDPKNIPAAYLGFAERVDNVDGTKVTRILSAQKSEKKIPKSPKIGKRPLHLLGQNKCTEQLPSLI